MNERHPAAQATDRPIAYIRKIPVEELPEEVRAEAGNAKVLYAIGNENGEHMALVKDRKLCGLLRTKVGRA